MENVKNILLPTDGSEYAKLAIKKAVSLAKMTGAGITALYVVDNSAFGAFPSDALTVDIASILKNEGEKAVGEVALEGEKHGVHVKKMIVEGVPSEEIIETSEHFDMVVMASLGRSGLSHRGLGSVTDKVLRHTSCNVLVVRPQDEGGEEGEGESGEEEK